MKRREVITLFGTAGFLGLSGFIGRNSSDTQSTLKQDTLTNHDLSAMKTIGILGGLGPQATIDLETRLHKAAQKLIPPMQNSGYPPVIVQYYRHPPVLLTEQNVPVSPWQPDPRMLVAAKQLGSIADFLIIPSNGAHLFQSEIEKAADRKVLSMIDITMEEVKKRKWKKVGALGMMNAKVYTNRLKEAGIEFEIIDDALQGKLNKSIMKTMEGREDDEDRATVMQAITVLRSKKVDGIIPGCTELPLLLGENMNADDLLNPAQLLAEAAIKYSLKGI